jgi:hypothetical protein
LIDEGFAEGDFDPAMEVLGSEYGDGNGSNVFAIERPPLVAALGIGAGVRIAASNRNAEHASEDRLRQDNAKITRGP